MKPVRTRIAIGLATLGTLMAAIAWHASRSADGPSGWIPVNGQIETALAAMEATTTPQPITVSEQDGADRTATSPSAERTTQPTQQATPSPSEQSTMPPTQQATPSPSEQSTMPPTQQATPTPSEQSTLSPTPSAQVADSRLDLNEATTAQLERLPGIGPSKAKAIVSYREQHGGYRSVDELLEVKGIGPKILDKLSPDIYVR
ncbi:helix-hairpin-helix domain-containing protein [Cohnella sp. GCM10027633]|uniref:ComEA family DNA-binding protein n=1 Tax=unclassified Cohnella TaxID=2636738 RepID=UPI00362E10CB